MTERRPLSSDRTGKGPPLVVIQQLDCKELWQPVVDRLAREHEVFGVDLPGFGRSPTLPPGQLPTITALAKAVSAWLDLVSLKQPAIAGCSVGGAVALELARAGVVSSAATISPVGCWSGAEAAFAVRSVGAARRAARFTAPIAPLVVGPRVGRRLALRQIVYRPERLPPAVAIAAIRNLARSPGVDPTRRQLLDYQLAPFAPDLPVTIAWGDRDRLTPPRQAERAAELVPAARHVTLAGCGHVPMFDDPDQVAEAIARSCALRRDV